MNVNVYTWSSVKCTKAAESLNAAVGFVLEYQSEKGPVTLNKTILLCNLTENLPEMTANGTELYAIKNALSRIKSCNELNIYTENQYVANAVKNGWTDKWKVSGWKTSKGEDVKCRREWEELLPLLEGRRITWHVKEHHTYREWLRYEVERGRQFVAPVQPVRKEGEYV